MHPEDERETLREWQVDAQELEGQDCSIGELLAMDWKDKKIHAGVHFKEVKLLYDKFKAERPHTLIMVVPEFRFESWFEELEREDAHWVSLDRTADNALLDPYGQPAGTFPFRVWMVGMRSRVADD